jgi:hypothetical protein
MSTIASRSLQKYRPLLIGTLLFFVGSILPAYAITPTPGMAQCPNPDDSKNIAYKTGFTYGCNASRNLEHWSLDDDSANFILTTDHAGPTGTANVTKNSGGYCNESLFAPYDTRGEKFDWRQGCDDGYTAGQTAYSKNFSRWIVSPKPDIFFICSNLQGYTRLNDANAQKDFLHTCGDGYRAAINNPRYFETTLHDFDTSGHARDCDTRHTNAPNQRDGCNAGFGAAVQNFEDFFPTLPAPTENQKTRASTLCGLTPRGANNYKYNGEVQGCLAGYDLAMNDKPNSCSAGTPHERMSTKQATHNAGYIDGCNIGYQKGATEALQCQNGQAQTDSGRPCLDQTVQSGGIAPTCNPSLPPNTPYSPNDPPENIPCGLNKAIELIKNIMNYLFMIAIPIAVLALGWGGFQIMTAAGNAGKAEEGISVMKVTVIGIVIMLSSYLVVQFIFKALGVTSEFTSFF